MPKKIYKRKCNYCGKYYEGQGKFYCSHLCNNKRKISRVKIKCKICGKIFEVQKHRKNTAKYCSNRCRIADKENWKKILSRRAKKRFSNPENHPCFGKPKSEETKEKIRKKILARKERDGFINSPANRKKQSKRMSGKNHHNWQNGISKEQYAFEFNNELKEKIRKRDNYTCQLCGKTQEEELKRKLTVHHMDYDKKNSIEENLITLCNSCNIIVNYNRDDWTIYFKNKLKENKCLKN